MRPQTGRVARRLPDGMVEALRSRPARIGAVVAVVALGAGAIAHGTGSGSAPAAAPRPTTATTAQATTVPPPSTTTTTVDSVPPGSPIDVPAGGLTIGDRGPAVLAVKQRLTLLRYDPGPVDDHYDSVTYQAVIAFEKVHSLPRNGRVTPDVATAMAADNLPQPMIAGAEPTRVEIDLTRQVLYFWRDDLLVRILPVSSGFGGHYCGDDGSCGIAVTPIGAYRTTSKIAGIHKSPLGELWNPVFFNQGIAIHGEPSVPAVPASHGCVRIPMQDSVWMYDQLTLGVPVYVRDATHVPVPFDLGGTLGKPQPGGTPPTVPRRTTTTRHVAPAAATTTVATVKSGPSTTKPH